MEANINPTNIPKYICEYCNLISNNKKDFNKHLLTSKHIKHTNILTNANEISQEIPLREIICICGKKYKHMSSLCKHKKMCNLNIQEDNIIIEQPNLIPPTIDLNLIMEVIKQNHDFKEMLFEQNKQMLERLNIIKNYKSKCWILPKILGIRLFLIVIIIVIINNLIYNSF